MRGGACKTTSEEAIKKGEWVKYILKGDDTKIYSTEKTFGDAIDLFNKSDKMTRGWTVIYQPKGT